MAVFEHSGCTCGGPCPVHPYFPNYVFPNYTTTTSANIEWSRPEYTGRHR